MTHPVNLEVGMTAIRLDGERAGPVVLNGDGRMPYSYILGRLSYKPDGSAWSGYANDIIAAGYPWATLGAQVGDRVCRVFSGVSSQPAPHEYVVTGEEKPHPDSLYIIVKRADAPKPADRPRASHKLDLHDGDVVELVAWECDCSGHYAVGDKFTVPHGILARAEKGHRPLFRVISRADDSYDLSDMPEFRAADAKQDEVQLAYGGEYKYTCTFPHGSDTGTVERGEM